MSKVRSEATIGVAVGAADRRDRRARAEQSRVEEIRAVAPGFQLEAAEFQHAESACTIR